MSKAKRRMNQFGFETRQLINNRRVFIPFSQVKRIVEGGSDRDSDVYGLCVISMMSDTDSPLLIIDDYDNLINDICGNITQTKRDLLAGVPVVDLKLNDRASTVVRGCDDAWDVLKFASCTDNLSEYRNYGVATQKHIFEQIEKYLDKAKEK